MKLQPPKFSDERDTLAWIRARDEYTAALADYKRTGSHEHLRIVAAKFEAWERIHRKPKI